MTTIYDLPEDLVEDEILSRVPMTSLRSVRSTCRKWNFLCKNRILFGKSAEPKKQFMIMDSRICLVKFDLCKDPPSMIQVNLLDQIQISYAFHCDGLLLCVLKDCSRLLVWNPYLGQTRWIEPRNSFQSSDRFAIGYDNNNLNHKILRIFAEIDPVTSMPVLGFEVYCLSSGSWKFLDVVAPNWQIWSQVISVSLKGNAYFTAQMIITETQSFGGFFYCFDFTTERFGPLLPLSFQSYHVGATTSLSCVGEDQLAELCQTEETIKISVTDKIGPNVVSWTKFLKVDLCVRPDYVSFFIEEEKKLAVVFVLERGYSCRYQFAYVIGQDGYFKSMTTREAPYPVTTFYPFEKYCGALVCSSYLPSLVQLTNQPTNGKNVINH